MILGRDSQPHITARNQYDIAWANSLGTANAITRSIEVELANIHRRPGASRAWIIEAQAGRRQAVLNAIQARKDSESFERYRDAQRITRRFMAAAAE